MSPWKLVTSWSADIVVGRRVGSPECPAQAKKYTVGVARLVRGEAVPLGLGATKDFAWHGPSDILKHFPTLNGYRAHGTPQAL